MEMKTIIKLQIELEVICDDTQADALQNGKLAQEVADNCFPAHKRRVLQAQVQDVEVCDGDVDALQLLESRYVAQAKAVPSPVGYGKPIRPESKPRIRRNLFNL
jgi:hypothetical protein